MNLRVQHFPWVFLGLYVWTLWARSLDNLPPTTYEERTLDSDDGGSPPDIEQRNASLLYRRGDGPSNVNSCSASCDYDGSQKLSRRWVEYDGDSPHLFKRVFDHWPTDDNAKDRYVHDTVDNGGCRAIVPGNTQGTPSSTNRGQSTAITAALGNQAFRYAMLHICGCAMLYVVNPQPSLADDNVKNDFIGQPDTYAVILGPDSSLDPLSPKNKLKWEDKVISMANTVRTILGFSPAPMAMPQDNSALLPGVVYYGSYVRVNGKTAVGLQTMDNTATGRFLFDYDPRAVGNQAGYRVIWQKSMLLADLW